MLSIPLIADDYPLMAQSLTYGAPSGLPVLLQDATFRLRSTTYWALFGLWHAGGITPWVHHSASLFLHIVNSWLVFAVVLAWRRSATAAAWAGFFFAIHEGHQEAVMWFAAISELLMFLFGMSALWCWMRGREWISVLLFALSLLSKESAVIFLPLFFLVTERSRWKRLLPHVALVGLAVASVAQSRVNSFRFNDGSFSLHAPFWITWPRSTARLLWIWGWIAGAYLLWKRDRKWSIPVLQSLAWIVIAFIPYIFLTYMTQIPSRQTYLASAGLAMLVGYAASGLRDRRIVAAVVALLLIHNAGYLWTKKRAQFLERSAPTTELIAFARRTSARIWVRCFPLPPIDAEGAVYLGVGRSPDSLVWTETAGAVEFCYREAPRLF